ncbi:2-C-methyl-D-erythritol 2,4-cyclodiphosphate synthase [Thermus scotoductus]|uniref:2-C-methyl-D-erythritol 2,4-cyclodiphosphate synthase n=1 Tax=Thermus scotoductus TaxID=37636 RepID=A0A430UNG3_THESC|nr:2-C-methyl-D-erythritol 2,4-cyclodiphosphate synthase [Thermus scotoductus]RTI07521.1 2-C-methyl-D-erythritol 2,4-cyclodiphosphate synthase [Thermus scotoductus]RTI57460.1 2-C-methyl-D-erythritol 2,4-cyclodiphosphate synthase [Thermus scotoductus]
MRLGYGEDSHRLIEGKSLYLCGLLIPSPHGALAHSDGDAPLHALTDALLAAFGLGDIGLLFPDTDPKWRGARSEVFLREALRLVEERGGRLIQVSLAIILDQPKLSPHRQGLLENLSRLLGLPLDRIGLTFKTSEGLAVAHVQARAMVLLDG